jgi:hypothetical protein
MSKDRSIIVPVFGIRQMLLSDVLHSMGHLAIYQITNLTNKSYIWLTSNFPKSV